MRNRIILDLIHVLVDLAAPTKPYPSPLWDGGESNNEDRCINAIASDLDRYRLIKAEQERV